ncbi:MAG: Hsp20/alpha crystallin family protein [Candidatus Paceibacterota bacterium]|jgi:HSP20 family protein
MLPVRRTKSSLNLFDNFFDELFVFPTWDFPSISNPLHDIVENEKEYVVEMALAGVKKEDISLNIEYDVLTIKAERKEVEDKNFNRKQTFYGKYQKSFTLPEATDKENIQASFENGILKITVPKIEEVKTTKQIKIK